MAHYRKGKRINNHRRLELLFSPGEFDAWEKAAENHRISMGGLIKAAMERVDPAELAKSIEPRRAA